MDKSADAYRTISEVAEDLKLPQHVLRFWETRFPQIKPMKRGGNRRFYRPEDVDLLRAIRTLLYSDGYTIKGVQRILKEQGPRAVAGLARTTSAAAAGPGPVRPPEPPDVRLGAADAGLPAAQPRHIIAEGQVRRVSEIPRASDPPLQEAARALEPPPTPDPDPPPAPRGYLSPDLADRLQAVLYDLSECERLMAAARP